jgi:peroxiredoxin
VKRAVSWILLVAWTLAASTAASADVSSLLSALDLGGYAKGERPPDFVGHATSGSRVSMADLRGKVVVLTFWATWCPPCKPELAVFENLYRLHDAEQLAVVAVNVRESLPVVRGYAEAQGLTFTVVADLQGDIQRAYGVIGLPSTFLIARDGRAVARAIGPRDWLSAPFRELLQALVGEPVPSPASSVRP